MEWFQHYSSLLLCGVSVVDILFFFIIIYHLHLESPPDELPHTTFTTTITWPTHDHGPEVCRVVGMRGYNREAFFFTSSLHQML